MSDVKEKASALLWSIMPPHCNELNRRTVLGTVGTVTLGALSVSGTAVAHKVGTEEICQTATECQFDQGPTYCCNRISDAGSLDSVTITAQLNQSPSGSVGKLKVENDSQESNCSNISNYDYVKELDSMATEVYLSAPAGQINIELRVDDVSYGGDVEIKQCTNR